jgi:5-methylcytosine-specific restriction endonuclease McrA
MSPALSYAERQEFLHRLSFADYRAYLRSELWSSIRGRVFARRGRRCWICHRKGKATQVHHLHYTADNLSGASTSGMRPVCAICHHEIEVDEDGRKRTAKATRRQTQRLRKSRGWRRKVRKLAAALARSKSYADRLDREFAERASMV